jgi:hypothetical protein
MTTKYKIKIKKPGHESVLEKEYDTMTGASCDIHMILHIMMKTFPDLDLSPDDFEVIPVFVEEE